MRGEWFFHLIRVLLGIFALRFWIGRCLFALWEMVPRLVDAFTLQFDF